jgi:hypothetical protein
MTLSAACAVENTAYIAYRPSGEFIDIVSRYAHLLNCNAKSPMDIQVVIAARVSIVTQQKVCMQNKLVGAACLADKELILWCQFSYSFPLRHMGLYYCWNWDFGR